MSRCGECKLGCNEEGALYCEENLGYEQCIDRLQDALYELSADRQGNWILTTLYVGGKEPKTAVRCSECKRIPLWLGSPILPTKSGNLLECCPHCGARMKGADDERHGIQR